MSNNIQGSAWKLPTALLCGLCLATLAPGCSSSGDSGGTSASTTGGTGSSIGGTATGGTGTPAVTGKVVGTITSTDAAKILSGAQSQTTEVGVQGTTITSAVGSDGTFELDGVPPGQQTVTAQSGDGSSGAVVVVSVLPGQTSVAGDIKLAPAGSLTGTVTSSTGTALGGAFVVATPTTGVAEAITDLPNGRPCFVAVTGPDGSYSLPALPPGPYFVSARDPGFKASAQSATITAGASTTANFKLTAVASTVGTIEGTATTTVDGHTVPVTNALVYLNNGPIIVPPLLPPILGGPPTVIPGTSAVTGGAGGSSTGSGTGGSGSVPGSSGIVSPSSLNVGDAVNDLTPPTDTVLPPIPAPQPFFTFTDSNGHFELDGVPAGTDTLVASKLGYDVVTQQVKVTAKETTTVSLAFVSNAGQISGTIKDAKTGQPLANAGVVIDQSGDIFNPEGSSAGTGTVSSGPVSSGGGTGIAIFPPVRWFAVTDSQGNYQIPFVLPGSYFVTGFDFNYLDQTKTASVAVGKTSTVDFDLTVNVGGGGGVTVGGTSPPPPGTTAGTGGGTSGSASSGTGVIPILGSGGSGSPSGPLNLGGTFGSLLPSFGSP